MRNPNDLRAGPRDAHRLIRWVRYGLLVGALALTQTASSRAEAAVDVPALIDQAAADFGMAEWARLRAHRIAVCESRYDPGAYNRRSGATGVYQWIPSSAQWMGINPWDAYQNVYAALRLMAAGQWQHWAQCL